MKAHLLKVPGTADHSFTLRQFRQANINNRWHYHPEIELIQIQQGSGTQFIGDDIRRFQAGDIILVGSNLPHFWRYDTDVPYEGEAKGVCSTVIHFTEKLWGKHFLQLPENKLLKVCFEKSNRGLLLSGKTREQVAMLMEKIQASEGTYRLIHLLECLVAIAQGSGPEVIPLASLGFQHQASATEHDRINAIYDFSFKHFRECIPLKSVAATAGLTPSSFCRYFKSKTGKSYSSFILELRVGFACKLLLEQKLNNKQICFESGFNNATCFHKYFKALTGLSPQGYQRRYAGEGED